MAEKTCHSAIDQRTTTWEGYAASLRRCNTVGGLRIDRGYRWLAYALTQLVDEAYVARGVDEAVLYSCPSST
ncbi:MAG: hypothetical protein JXA57_17985 [Armatimonadetes bacterium]|nr:hypothetical protein [Armatimonadota bacterium]